MAFIGLMFVFGVLICMPVCGLVFLALSLLFRRLHRRYLLRLAAPPAKKWRRILSILFAVLAALNLLAGAAGWIFMRVAGA